MGSFVGHPEKHSRLKEKLKSILIPNILLPLLAAGCFFLSGVLGACADDEDYTTSPTDRLEFSTDSVKFDTVISGEPTNTYTFMVYNRNRKPIRIPRVYLERGGESVFRVNVDGTYLAGGSATDFEIAAEDSLRVFLEMTATVQDSDEPVEATDKLVFQCESGTQQEVVLTAYGQDVVRLEALVVAHDTLLAARRPYHVLDSLVVAEGATLTVGEGVRFYFAPDARLIVRGTLRVDGTAAAPVIMRGDRMGNMFSNQPYDRIPGQWGGVVFCSESYGNVLNHCDIHSGQFGIRCDSADVEREKLQLLNSIVHNTTSDALNACMSYITVINCQLSNAGGNCVRLLGGDNVFVHCTIAGFYPFAGREGVALSFDNGTASQPYPILNAAFLNCIITGYGADEIMGTQSAEEAAFNYYLKNCLLNTPEPDKEDERIVDCIWDNSDNAVSRDKNFTPDFDLARLTFSFSLSPESKAIGNADPQIALEYAPTDMDGRDRMADGAPDMGCYEAQPQTGGDTPQANKRGFVPRLRPTASFIH